VVTGLKHRGRGFSFRWPSLPSSFLFCEKYIRGKKQLFKEEKIWVYNKYECGRTHEYFGGDNILWRRDRGETYNDNFLAGREKLAAIMREEEVCGLVERR